MIITLSYGYAKPDPDVPSNRILSFDEEDNQVSVFRPVSKVSNEKARIFGSISVRENDLALY